MDLNVSTLNARVNKKQEATIDIGFRISSRYELNKVIDKLTMVDGIRDVTRTKG